MAPGMTPHRGRGPSLGRPHRSPEVDLARIGVLAMLAIVAIMVVLPALLGMAAAGP